MKEEYRSNLSKIKNKGSARSGTVNYIRQRLTAVFLIPFVFWFAFTIIQITTNPALISDFIASPCSIFLSLFFIGNILYHGYLGMHDIIEDYVRCKIIKNSIVIALIAVCLITFIASCTSFFVLHLIYFLKN